MVSCRDGDTATVHYTGRLASNGKVFDSSVLRPDAEPFRFVLGQEEVIPCWDNAIANMQVGEKATLTCPPSTAYGDEPQGDVIPAHSTLLFDVEVLNCETTY